MKLFGFLCKPPLSNLSDLQPKTQPLKIYKKLLSKIIEPFRVVSQPKNTVIIDNDNMSNPECVDRSSHAPAISDQCNVRQHFYIQNLTQRRTVNPVRSEKGVYVVDQTVRQIVKTQDSRYVPDGMVMNRGMTKNRSTIFENVSAPAIGDDLISRISINTTILDTITVRSSTKKQRKKRKIMYS